MRKSARRPIPWRSTYNAPVPSVAAMWGSWGLNGRPRCLCKRSMGGVWGAAIGSPGYSCKARKSALRVVSRPVVHYTKTLCVATRQERRLAMLPNVIILVFTALASSFLWWRTRFKICRRCRSRIRWWASVCRVCGAEQWDREQNALLLNQICYSPCSKNETLP